MLTKAEIQRLATETLRNEGVHLVAALEKSELYDGFNLAALLEIFADKLEAAKSPDIVAVIDARMGPGWTRGLAEAIG